MDEDGGFLVAWTSDDALHDFSESSLRGRWYAPDNQRSAEFQVNAYTTGSQISPVVGLLGDRRARVAWDNDDDGTGGSGTTEPRTGEALLCHGPGKTKLSMKRGATPDKDQIKWKLVKSTGALPEALGDPTATTSYFVDVMAGPDSLLSQQLSPSGNWSVSNSGAKYGDKDALLTPVTRVTVKHGNDVDSRGSAQMRAGGSGLGLPSLFITDPVSVLVRNSENECWAATYDLPSQLTVDRYQATE
jgi:hypothetical protein